MMGVYCVISPGGAPGATTTALALALTWRGPLLLAEADPGGRRILPGFLADKLNGRPPGPGLLGLAMEAQHDAAQAPALVEEYAIALPGNAEAVLLHGIRDPRHARQLTQVWEPLADVLADSGRDVIADVGRVGGADTPIALLARADLIVMVLRPTLAGVDAARPRIEALHDQLRDQRSGRRAEPSLALCMIDDGAYAAGEVRRNLFDLPVLAELPHAPADARVLSDGARPRVSFRTSLLMRSAAKLGQRLRQQVEERAFTRGRLAQPPAFGGGR
jgi:hypothetical protein